MKVLCIRFLFRPGPSLYLSERQHGEVSRFSLWLQCYYQPGMSKVADHNKRTMWFHGDPGPLVPKGSARLHSCAHFEMVVVLLLFSTSLTTTFFASAFLHGGYTH